MTMTNRLEAAQAGDTAQYRASVIENANTTVFNSGVIAGRNGFQEMGISHTGYAHLGTRTAQIRVSGGRE